MDIKKLYFTSYLGIVLMNVLGGGFLILLYASILFELDIQLMLVFIFGGIFMLMGVCATLLWSISNNYYGKGTIEPKHDQTIENLEGLEEEQNNK